MVNGAIFLDLKKAFDTVDHRILLLKLQMYGFDSDSRKWFSAFLQNRYQHCAVNGKISSACPISCGVPQGTILGPLFFLLFINDLPNTNMGIWESTGVYGG